MSMGSKITPEDKLGRLNGSVGRRQSAGYHLEA